MNRTPQDGNCLFSAVSIALIGNNMLATTLRKLCAIELYKNANFFAVHPVFRLGHLSGVFRSERSAFLLGISNVACTAFEAKKSKVDAILAEAFNISQSGVWSSLVCVMSISNVLKIPLKLFYPTTGDACLEYLFRSTLYPQTFKKFDEPYQIIYLLLYNVESKKEISDNLTHMGKMHYFKPNHFVPLVSIISTQPEFRNILVRTQTSLNSSKNIVVTGEKRPLNNSLLQIPCSAVQKINLTKPSLSIKNFFSVNNKPLPVSSSSSVLSNKFEKPISGVVIPKLNVNCENATTEDDCNEFDIGLFVDKVGKLSNQEKRNILLNVWILPSDYVFPKTNGHKCNPAWFKKFSWLCYSKYYDGLFCISCVLFGKASSTSQLFHEYLFRFWSVENVRIISHNNTSPMHKTSIQIMLDFQAVISRKTVPINLQLNKFLSDNIFRNRQILFSISRAILFCCRQNIPLRGHRDDAKHLALQCNNAGNFQCFLDLMALCGDKILSDHFKNGPKNATYRSKTVQNELIDICADVVRSLLTNRIKKANFFSILADEASDVSQTEQMAVVVRYVDECCKVKEDFLKFVSCNSGLTGVLLSTKIKKSIHKLGLEMSYCRGQGYDGAGNMAGHLCGVAALILKDFPKAPYIHCYSHQLNLCVAKACAIPSIRDMMLGLSLIFLIILQRG
nr:zinc finger MYM-type protein 1-like isoform X2 [Hydra vulgaris]